MSLRLKRSHLVPQLTVATSTLSAPTPPPGCRHGRCTTSGVPRGNRSQNGLTLIELMIVVAIVGILAGLAMYMFGGQSDRAKVTTEVAAMFAEFKVRQEQYHLENGAYLSTGASETDTWPPAPSGPSTPTELRPMPAGWTNLRMNPDKSAVYCSYVSIAGTTDPSSGTPTPSPGSIASSDFGYTPPVGNWYYLVAECDMDDDASVNAIYFARSDREGLLKLNEGH